MPGIIRNNVIYASVPSEEGVLANYVTETELTTRYGNVDNTADANKRVSYATSAGDAATVNNHTIAADIPANAAFTDTTYTLTQDENDGHILYFTPVVGTATILTMPDNDTTYDNLSDFNNDCGFITNAVNDLVNYYTKSTTYTKTEVNQLISTVPSFSITVVPDLNIQNPSTTTIYLVPNTGTGANVYDEYVYVYDETTHTGTFEKLGTQSIDLTQYYTAAQTDTLLSGKADNINWNSGSNTLQLKSGSTVLSSVTITGGGTAIRLADVTGATATVYHDTITLQWSDPEDITISGVTLAEWAGTKVVRKAGSAPVDVTDGTLVVNSTVHNAYSSTGYEDTGLTYGTTYYYRFFPYTTENLITTGSSVSGIPVRETIVNVPSQDGTLIYDGTIRTAVFNNYDATKMTVTGNTGTNADTYTAVFTPKDGYQWSDESITGKSVTWTIGKAEATATLSADSVTLDGDHLTATVTISNPSGTIGTPTTSDATIATVSLSESVITISSVNDESGSATITIPLAASANYNAGNITIAVIADFIEIVTWADGTDEQIVAMVEAADAGKINLTEYWSVGNERTVHIEAISELESQTAQDVVLVLVAEDTGVEDDTNPCYNYTYATPTSGRSYPSFIFHMKNCFPNRGLIHNDDVTGWPYTRRGIWCDGAFKNAFPQSLLNAVKQVTFKAYFPGWSGSYQNSTNYFFLPANREVCGGLAVSTYDGGTLCPYYETTSNRIKRRNSSATDWWFRVPYNGTDGKNLFFTCTYQGSHSSTNVYYTQSGRKNGVDNGICVGGCI